MALLELIEDPQLRVALAEEAQADAARRSWESSYRELLAAYATDAGRAAEPTRLAA